MKKVMKNLFAGIGVAAIAFAGYVIWDKYAEAKERASKEEREAKVRADAQAFIERRKAHAAAKAAAVKAQEETPQQAVMSCTDTETVFAQEEDSAKTKESTAETGGGKVGANNEVSVVSAEAIEESKEG